MKNILTLLAVVLTLNSYSSTLVANAGNNATIACPTGSVLLGGSPSAMGGIVPYIYSWSPSEGLSDSTSANPIAAPTKTTTYILTVLDSEGTAAKDTVVVNVASAWQIDAGPDISTCINATVQLNSNVSPAQSGVGPKCSSVAAFGTIGNDTLSHQTMLAGPSLFANFRKSYRNQMLYKASELTAALGGAKTISAIGFNITTFNSNAILSNFSISITSTNNDSLTTSFNNSLTTVFARSGYSPFSGWNIVNLDTGFVWDGVSNLIVEVCCYSPNTFGNQPNIIACTNTNFPSYGYAIANTDLCGINGIDTLSSLRPNIRFGYCTPTYPPFTYGWTPSTGLSNSSVPNPIVSAAGNVTYTVNVTDSQGCSASDTVRVSGSGSLTLNSINTTNASCHGFSNGAVCLSVMGYQPPLNILWNNNANGACATGLVAGTYTVTVSDATCSLTASGTVNDGEQVILDSANTINTCIGGSSGTFCVSVLNGTSPYSYTWSNPAPNQACAANLSVGTYRVTVTDALGCSASSTAVIASFGQLEIDSVVVGNTLCGDTTGSVCVYPSQGISPYYFNWSNGANVVTCLQSLGAGTYIVTITDANGCTATATGTINSSTTPQIDTAIITDVSCNGASSGAIDITVPGAFNTYAWSNSSTTQDITNLVAGTYAITVTDQAAGCYVTASYVIGQPSTLSVSTSHTDATCGLNNGTITITIAGGTPPYMYMGNPIPAGTFTTTPLSAGIYAGNVIDANGCTIALIDTILQLGGGAVISITNDGDGIYPDTLGLTVTGGCAPYQYTWSTGEQNNTTQAVAAGIYGVTVTDCQGCSSTASVNVGGFAISFNITDVTCFGQANGTATLIATGGTPPYQYSIDGGITFQSSNFFSNLLAGNYSIIVTDALLAAGTNSFTLTEPTALSNSVTSSNVTCFGSNDGSACLFVTGGTGTYVYNWSPNISADSCATTLAAGNYSITVSDVNNCTFIAQITITQPATLLQAHLVSSTGGALPDTLTTIVTGGVPPYIYSGSNGTTVQQMLIDFSGLGSCYTGYVTDANGCPAVTDTFCYICTDQCVWPGDANYDGVADNNDLLPIGLAYGTNGPARLQTNIGWYAHNASNWIDTLSNGANYKHIDCDGNGVVDSNDTLAIIQNYALVHAKNEDEEPWRANAPELYVRLVPDTTHAGDTLYANLILGTTNIPANSVYGLAFTVNYDALVVDSTKTRATFGASWLGTATDKISIGKDLPAVGKVKCAVTRIDHTTRSGNGQIGQVTFVITTDNINGKDFGYYNTRVWISDMLMIDNNGVEIPVNAGRDSTSVEYEPLDVNNIKLDDGSLKIQPNPAANAVQFSVTKDLLGAEIRLTDLSGRLLKAMPITALNLVINTSELSGGIYLVQAVSAKGTITKRLIITR